MPAREWIEMTALLLLGLLPFAALGIALGHLLTVDSLGPVIGGTTALLAFLGGVWFPLGDGFMGDDRPSPCRPTGSSRPATSGSAARAGARPAGP